MAYNNAWIWINTQNYQVTYFWNNRAFDNGWANTGSNLVPGSSSPVWRTNGVLTWGELTWDFLTNPLNFSGNYLLNWSGTWASLRWRILSYYNEAKATEKHSYGSGILTQIHPVYYDNTTLKNWWLFNSGHYIWSDVPKVSGELLWLPEIFTNSQLSVSGNSISSLVWQYSVFGDLMSYIIEENKWTTTGISLAPGLANNRVVSQLLKKGAGIWENVWSPWFSAGEASFQSLAIDENWTVFVAYSDWWNWYKTTVMKFNGSSWINVWSPWFSAGQANNQSLAIDNNWTAFVAYSDWWNWYKTTVMKFNGSNWINVWSPWFSAGVAYNQSLAIDNNWTPYVAYMDNQNWWKTTVMKFNGSSWTNVWSPWFSAGGANFQSLAIDENWTVFVAYSDWWNWWKTTVMKFNGSSWINVWSPWFSAGQANNQSLALAGDWTPYVAYMDNQNWWKTTVMKFNGSSWTNVWSPWFSAGQTNSQSLAIAGDWTPYVAYMDWWNWWKTTVMKFNGSSWTNVWSPWFSAGQANNQSLVIDDNWILYVAYTDWANNYKTTVMNFYEKYFATHFQTDTKMEMCLSGWNNDNFIDDSFWAQNPSDLNILCAIYGSGGTDKTAYTQFWKWWEYADSCNVVSMSVVHVTNPNNIPFGNISSNTVYVFPSGSYNLPNNVYMEDCSAFISSGDLTIRNINNNIQISRNYIVLDNINIDSDVANYGLLVDLAEQISLHNMNVYNAEATAIEATRTTELYLDTVNIFNNNKNGIFSNRLFSSIFNNINVHNNKNIWILLEGDVFDTTINNSKIYNNYDNIVMILNENSSINNSLMFNSESNSLSVLDAKELLINNSMIFDSANNGLVIEKNSSTLLANTYIYNNANYWVVVDSSSSLDYWGKNYSFSNYVSPFAIDGYVWAIPAIPEFGWSDWEFYDDWWFFNQIWFRMSWDYLVNVLNDQNEYMLKREPRYDVLLWQVDFDAKYPLKYSYGSGIITQSVPVLFYAGVWLGTWLSFDPDKFIWSNVDKYAWALQMPAYVSGTTITVTGTADPNDVNKYNLYSTEHLTTNYIWNNINNPVNITLNNRDWWKKIVTQIENTNNAYFATHFERETILDTSAPVTTDNANSVWRKTDFLVTLNAVDWGIGVDYTLYCITTTPSGCTPNITWTSVNVTCAVGNTCPAQYVRYRSVDQVWNTESIKTSPVIRIDKQWPTFTFNNNSWAECVAWNLSITSASDAGVWLHTSPYSFNNWSTRQSSSVLSLPAQQPWIVTRTGYVRDALSNQTIKTATYTFNDTMPTANNFTGHANVWSGAKTVNWKTLSDAKDGACWAWDMSFDSIVTQWARWVCSVNGNNITYTPNQWELWNDLCVIKIKDNEWNMINITVGWWNISSDTTAPTTTDNANSTWRKTDLPVTLTAVDTWVWVAYTLYCTWTTTSCTPNITWTSLTVTCESGTTCPQQYVRYRSVDQVWNTESIKTSPVIRIDKQWPTFTFNNNSWAECVAWNLSITSASDAGVWLHTSPYSFNGSTWGTTTSTSITAQQPWTQNRTAYVRDALLNIWNQSATYTFTDSMPTANDFTGHANVGDSIQTGNWKILSNAIDGACGSGDISLDGIVYQWQKWICNVVGDEISYTPNINQFGNDSCAIKIKDNENNTVNVIVYWENINTMSNPIIFFTGVNPVDNIVWDRNRYTSQIQIEQTQNMDVFEYNFSGTNYSVYDSGLILMMNLNNINLLWESAGSVVKDFSMNDNSSFVYAWSTWTWNGVWWWAYYFDGNGRIRVFWNEYNFSDQSDFSASIRFYVSDVPSNGDNMGIFWKRNGWRTAAWAIDYHYWTSNDYLRAWIRNGSVRTYTIPWNQRNMRYHVTFVHTSDKISSLYINGQFISSWSYSTSWSLSDGDLFLGSSISSIWGNPTNFIGMLDEPRIYNRALSAQEIQFLYKSNLRKFDTDKRLFETLNTCLWWNDTYSYTWYVESIYGQFASTGRTISTDIPGLFATWLTNFDFGEDSVSSSIQTKTGQYQNYIEVHDAIANTWWIITVAASDSLTWQNSPFSISSDNLFFMKNSLDLLSGTLPSTLSLNNSLQDRSYIHNAPIDYFIKTYDPNDFMCDGWIFGDKPHLKLNIPAYQAPDLYVGTLHIMIAPE
jgi:hypothetical protein